MKGELDQPEHWAIVQGLSSSDGEVRRLSVEQLLVLSVEEAVPYLMERLGDENWRVRKAAVERLVRCVDHPPVQQMLVASLSDREDPGRRNSAFEALVACGSRMTPRLVRELSNTDVNVRKLVTDALAAIGDPNYPNDPSNPIDPYPADNQVAQYNRRWFIQQDDPEAGSLSIRVEVDYVDRIGVTRTTVLQSLKAEL